MNPLLQQLGLQLVEREAGSFILPVSLWLIVKDSDWRWPKCNLAGNAIDFHVQVIGLSLNDASRCIFSTTAGKVECLRSPTRGRRVGISWSGPVPLNHERTPININETIILTKNEWGVMRGRCPLTND